MSSRPRQRRVVNNVPDKATRRQPETNVDTVAPYSMQPARFLHGNNATITVSIAPSTATPTAPFAIQMVPVVTVTHKATVRYITSVGQTIPVNTINKGLLSNSFQKRAIPQLLFFASHNHY